MALLFATVPSTQGTHTKPLSADVTPPVRVETELGTHACERAVVPSLESSHLTTRWPEAIPVHRRSKELWGQLTSRGHGGAGTEAERAASRLGPDGPRSTEAERGGTERIPEETLWGQMGRKVSNAIPRSWR